MQRSPFWRASNASDSGEGTHIEEGWRGETSPGSRLAGGGGRHPARGTTHWEKNGGACLVTRSFGFGGLPGAVAILAQVQILAQALRNFLASASPTSDPLETG